MIMTKILGVRVDNLSKTEALNKVSEFFVNGKQNIIFTPNPEMLVDATRDKYFKDVLNSGDLNICDGFGIRFVSWGKIKRITGVDFVLDICALAEKENKSIFLLGTGKSEILNSAKINLQKKYPALKIAGLYPGLKIDFLKVDDNNKLIFNKEANDEILSEIVMSGANIVLVAFGHEKQEKWIVENMKNLPGVSVLMGVGGSLDYISGRVARAPLFLRQIGLEWLYRLVKQPWRLKRIFKATFLFLYLIIFSYD